MKDMKELKKKLHVLHELHGDLSLFVVPARAWMLVATKNRIRNQAPENTIGTDRENKIYPMKTSPPL